MSTALTPVDRLALSRERLARAMKGEPPFGPATQPGDRGAGPARWADELSRLPGAGIVIAVARQWWARHPMRATALLGVHAVRLALPPLAQRHPIGLIVGAAVVIGGLLAWRRPRRWTLRALWAGLLPQLMLAALAAAKQQQRAVPTPALAPY